MHISHLADALIQHNSTIQHLIFAPAPIAGANKILLQEAQIHTGFALLFREIAPAGSHTGPTWKTTQFITVTVRWLVCVATVFMGFRIVLNLCSTVCNERVVCRRLQEWCSDRNANPMFACPLVAVVRRALTGDGDSVANGDKIFMIGWFCMTGIPNANTPRFE